MPELMTPTKPPQTPSDQRCLSVGIRQALVLAVIMFSSLGGYLAVLKWRGHDYWFKTYTAWDDLVPFQPGWVWVYLLPYLIGPIAIGALRPSTFNWYVKRGLAVVAISLAIFVLMPTQVAQRPPPPAPDNITDWMYVNMAQVDEPPANAAPSLHVSLTCLLALALLIDFPRWWWLTSACVLVVWLATLFTRQHHLIDVASGAALASLVVVFWPRKRIISEQRGG